MTEIIPKVHKVDGSKGSNCYLIIDYGITIIDTGMKGTEDAIGTHLNSLGMNQQDIKRIVLTHWHPDHTQCAKALKAATGARVMAGEMDADVISGKAPIPKNHSSVLLRWLMPLFRSKPVEIDTRLKDGDLLDVLQGLEVISLPGHTEGNIALFSSKDRLIFSSDTVSNRKGILGPPNGFKLNREGNLKAIKHLSELDFDIMLPGHGPPIMRDASRKVAEFYASLSSSRK